VLTEDFIRNFELFDPDALGPFVAGWLSGEIEAGGGGGSRLRGFVPATYRNGFSRTGVGEVVNVARVEVIKGPLSAMFGNSNPGGLVNYVTKRAKRKPEYILSVAGGTYDYFRAEASATGPLVANKLFYRVDASHTTTEGVQDFFFTDTTAVSGALTWELGPNTQVIIELEQLERTQNRGDGGILNRYDSLVNSATGVTAANVIGGVNEDLLRRGFNQFGPDIRVDREITTADLRVEHRFNETWSLRANLQWWDRVFDDYRWTTPQYYVQRDQFVGREPFRHYQPEDSKSAQVDLLASFTLGNWSAHKLLFSVDWTEAGYLREDYQMRVAERNTQLPLAVRNLSPSDPQYGQYSRDSLTRWTRQEIRDTGRIGLLVSERMALREGRFIGFVAGRFEKYDLDYSQRAATTDTAAQVGIRNVATGELIAPTVGASDDEAFTLSVGFNAKLAGDSLVLFANRSESFEGFQTQIDRGTGGLIGAPEGVGYEMGLRGNLKEGRVYWTTSAFEITRTNIAQRNPLYVSDPDTGELPDGIPQFIGSASERSVGGELEIFGDVTPNFSLTFAVGYVDATTRRNPDTPEIEGRKLLRAPEWNVGTTATYRFRDGALKGFTVGGSVRYTDEYYARFGGFGSTVTGTGIINPLPTAATVNGVETTARIEEIRPSQTLASMFIQKGWQWGRVSHTTRVSVSNLFNDENWTVTGRLGTGREFRLSHRVRF
jgi:outer membrane receptor protein involved in Fe transport